MVVKFISDNQEFVRNLLRQKNYMSEQLRLLRKYRNHEGVQKYINSIYNDEFASEWAKYQIDKYYYNKKDLVRAKKNSMELMCSKTSLNPDHKW